MSNGYSGARPRSTACSMATEQPVNTRAESERNMNHPTTLDRAITANHSEVLLGRALTANHSEVLLGRAFTSNHSEVLLGRALTSNHSEVLLGSAE
jgi:hypothetical protein